MDDSTWFKEHPNTTARVRLPRADECPGVVDCRLVVVRQTADREFRVEPVTAGSWEHGSRWLRPNRDGAVRE